MKQLKQVMEELADFEPTHFPFISLYLNTQPDQHGRANFDSFVRKEFRARGKTYTSRSSERESFDRDTQRIEKYLRDEVQPSSNGLAIFACAGANDFFEAVQLQAPIQEHNLYLYHQPHLYPLARLMDQYRRYAVLVADTSSARLFIFGLGTALSSDTVSNPKASRTSVGGWSQMRYQRHIDNYHRSHAKEIVDAIDRLMREEGAEHIILAGDKVIIPVLKEQLPQHLSDKLIDVLRIDINTPDHELFEAAAEAFREHDAQIDAEKVERLLDEFRAGGLALVGAHDSLAALNNGQVDELLIIASLEQIHEDEEEVGALLAPDAPANEDDHTRTRTVLMADELVTKARQTGARVTFIEDESLLAGVGGVGVLLRYRL